jgi:hypothetical protein
VASFDGTTAVTVQVTSPAGVVTAPVASTVDVGATWTTTFLATESGTWIVKWTITGKGLGVEYSTVEVDPTPTEDQSTVRLLISDTDKANRFFSTVEIGRFLTINGGTVRRAAAQALDVWAANEAMVAKKITTQDLQTDGPAVAAALRAAATELRRQADDGEGDLNDIGFEIVEYVPYPHHDGWRV